MCINTKLENENWDATNSWSGYNYQGKIALFVVLKKINELISIGKVDEIEKYSIELEWLEDFYCIKIMTVFNTRLFIR